MTEVYLSYDHHIGISVLNMSCQSLGKVTESSPKFLRQDLSLFKTLVTNPSLMFQVWLGCFVRSA